MCFFLFHIHQKIIVWMIFFASVNVHEIPVITKTYYYTNKIEKYFIMANYP